MNEPLLLRTLFISFLITGKTNNDKISAGFDGLNV